MFFQIFKTLTKLTSKNNFVNESYISAGGTEEILDQTGRIVSSPKKLKTTIGQDDIVFSNFENSVAHSFWRSQELSIFQRAKQDFKKPILDFGCGDGAFSACIFEGINFGVDIDEKALGIATLYDLYDELITFESLIRKMPNASIETVFSCSVLEHTTHLSDCISQISRILKPGGRFYFTVPNTNFTDQMVSLVDKNFAENMNKRMFHRNLLDEKQWTNLLVSNGFRIVRIQSFQPISFTKKYFSLSLLGQRALGAIPGVSKLFLSLMMSRLMSEVNESISGIGDKGANYYVIASKI